MRAAWYERPGLAADVLVVGEMPDPEPGPGEVRIRIAASGINPGDVKKREDAFGLGMAYPRVIPHSDGAGVVDRVGDGVPGSHIGERVWCFGAQSYRSFGTAADYVIVPADQAVPLPESVSFEQGACLGIPGITAHRAVHVAGPPDGRAFLVQGGAGAVGQCAIGLARHAGAHVIATVRSERDRAVAERAGAHHVVDARAQRPTDTAQEVLAIAPDGVDHVIEVAFSANVALDEQVLRNGGSIAAYSTLEAAPGIPFWLLVFKNIRIDFLGSDDFPDEVKRNAARDINAAISAGWPGFAIEQSLPLDRIAEAHEWVEQRRGSGRVVLRIGA